MINSVANNIINMIKCRQGEHCLFRTFGLGAITDDIARVSRSLVQVEVNKWFPGNTVYEVKQSGQNSKGEFEYNIRIRG